MELRPTSIQELVGQEHLKPELLRWVSNPATIPNALLLHGPFGTGKTTVAKILAAALTSDRRDIKEYNTADTRGIDEVRQMVDQLRISPLGPARVLILDEMQQLTKDAQNCLLKPLESPPPRTYFFFCTTEPQRLIAPLASRLTKLAFRLLTDAEMVTLVRRVNPNLPPEQAENIARMAEGHARDAVLSATTGVAGGLASANAAVSPASIRDLVYRTFFKDIPPLSDLRQVPEALLSSIADEYVDSWFPNFEHVYHKLVTLRSARRQYTVTAIEYLLAVRSLLRSPGH